MKQIIERRFGHGAARLALRGAPLRRRSTPSLREGWRAALREEGDEIRDGVRRVLTRNAAPTLAAIAVSILLGAFLRERPDSSAVEIVPFMEPPPIAVEEPEPEPEPIVEPEPEPAPIEVAEATPEPPPVVIPEPPKPAPPPPPKAPKPEPPKRTPPPPRIDPVAAPVVARAPAPPPPPRPTRAPAPAPKRTAPPVAFAGEALPPERAPDTAPTRRATPFQTARTSDARLRPALDAPTLPHDDYDAPPETSRSSRVAASPTAPSRKAAPLDFASAALPAAPGDAPRRESPTRRPVPGAPPRRRERGTPSLAMPAAPARDPLPPSQPTSVPRTARPTAPTTTTAARRDEPGLRGVPLASLDACRSDRDEDLLKQRVVAAAEDRGRCESAAGSFTFVETKNLNAFLMRIERAPGRRLGDRCSELLHALDCLAKSR